MIMAQTIYSFFAILGYHVCTRECLYNNLIIPRVLTPLQHELVHERMYRYEEINYLITPR